MAKKQVKILKDKLRKSKRQQLFLLFVFFVITMFVMCTMSLIVYGRFGFFPFVSSPNNQLVVEYRGMNDTQIENIRSVLNDINPIYLKSQNRVIFTKEIGQYCRWCAGINLLHSSIVLYSDNESYMREILCHELMHSFSFKSNEAHDIVYDLGQKQICYGWQAAMEEYIEKEHPSYGNGTNLTLSMINKMYNSQRTETFIMENVTNG